MGRMTYGSLFAGIGGLDLGLDRAGMTCKWQVELDDYATRVLERHWPNVRRWRDICTFPPDANDWSVDLIAAGFPCQDISHAGKGAGIHGKRSGLFFQTVRVVRELRPRYVLLENVSALLNRGLDTVLRELAEIGYDAEWHCVPAAAVGAPHIRDRIFIVAHADSRRCGEMPKRKSLTGSEAGPAVQSLADSGGKLDEAIECIQTRESNIKGSGTDVPHATGDYERGVSKDKVSKEIRGNKSGNSRKDVADANSNHEQRRCGIMQMGWQWGSEETPLNSDAEGTQWAVEPDVGRVAHGVPARVDRLKCLGNAVVPQGAELIGSMIISNRKDLL